MRWEKMKDKPRWLEAGIFFSPARFTIRDIFWVYEHLISKLEYESWHYFLEPNYELRFRVLADKKNRDKIRKRLKDMKCAYGAGIRKIVFRKYNSEQGLYGKVGFEIAQDYFKNGADTAARLIFAKEFNLLTSPYKKWSPVHFHLNRYVHLFANQLGYSIWDEFKWAIRYAWNRLIVWAKYKAMGVKGR